MRLVAEDRRQGSSLGLPDPGLVDELQLGCAWGQATYPYAYEVRIFPVLLDPLLKLGFVGERRLTRIHNHRFPEITALAEDGCVEPTGVAGRIAETEYHTLTI